MSSEEAVSTFMSRKYEIEAYGGVVTALLLIYLSLREGRLRRVLRLELGYNVGLLQLQRQNTLRRPNTVTQG